MDEHFVSLNSLLLLLKG